MCEMDGGVWSASYRIVSNGVSRKGEREIGVVGSNRYGWDDEGCDEVSGLPGTQNVVDCTPPSLCNPMWYASQPS